MPRIWILAAAVIALGVISAAAMLPHQDDWSPIHTYRAHHSPVRVVALGDNEQFYASADESGHVCVWDIEQNQPIAQIDLGRDEPVALSLSVKHGLVVLACSNSPALIWRYQSTAKPTVLQTENIARLIAIRPDGALVATVDVDNHLRTWNAHTGEMIAEAKAPEDVGIAMFYPESDVVTLIQLPPFSSNNPNYDTQQSLALLSMKGWRRSTGDKTVIYDYTIDFHHYESTVSPTPDASDETLLLELLIPSIYPASITSNASIHVINDRLRLYPRDVVFNHDRSRAIVARGKTIQAMKPAEPGDWMASSMTWIALGSWVAFFVALAKLTQSGPPLPPVEEDHPLSPPLDLKIVSVLCIIYGALTVVNMIVSLFHDSFVFDLSILLLFAGPGLLKLRNGWRVFTLILLWPTFFAIGMLQYIAISSPQSIDYNWFGKAMPSPPHLSIICMVLGGVSVMTLWVLYVLTRPGTRALFRAASDRRATEFSTTS